MRNRIILTSLPVLLAVAGCNTADIAAPEIARPDAPSLQAARKGSGLALDIVPDVTLPLGLGGSITIDQAVLTNFAVVENTVGQVVGLRVTGTLTGTAVDVLGGAVGLDAQPFVADLNVTSSGPGQCSVVTLDLSNLNVDALGLVTGTVPANVNVKGSGAVGSLLCNLGQSLAGVGGALGGQSATGLVNAINNQL